MLTSIMKKALTALTGVALVGFIITHLAGNAFLYFPDSAPFNTYVQKLHSWGICGSPSRVGFGQADSASRSEQDSLKVNNKTARPVGYKMWKSKKAFARGPFVHEA